MVKYMKFIGWDNDQAWFRPATTWERIKAWWYWRFIRAPDTKNIIIDFEEADKILKEYGGR